MRLIIALKGNELMEDMERFKVNQLLDGKEEGLHERAGLLALLCKA